MPCVDRLPQIAARFSRRRPASDHRDELALGVGIAVDVSLSCLDRAMTGQ